MLFSILQTLILLYIILNIIIVSNNIKKLLHQRSQNFIFSSENLRVITFLHETSKLQNFATKILMGQRQLLFLLFIPTTFHLDSNLVLKTFDEA